MADILHTSLDPAPWTDPRAWRLPGTQPVAPDGWVRVDEAFAGQMALRDDLIATRTGEVVAETRDARPAVDELAEMTLDILRRRKDYIVAPGQVTRPDGVMVPLAPGPGMATVGRLIQADLCLLERAGQQTEHHLTAAVLCFPASWTLSEKIGRPMRRLHRPVARYDADIALRVQRLLDGIRPDRPLWRANAHFWDHATLFAPKREVEPHRRHGPGPFVRSEYQVLFRLPRTGAIGFSIHTRVIRTEDLPPDQARGLSALTDD